jgi:isocitrate dehydrogenase (NAD+)
MLRAMDLKPQADQIESSIFKVLNEGKFVTKDLGGKSGTTEYTKAIIGNL